MQPVARSTVQAFYEAYASGDAKRVAPFLDDDVSWMISGPVDVLRFCGQRRGKAEALEVIEHLVPATYTITHVEHETQLIEGDRVASLFTLAGTLVGDRRNISYRIAHFLRFRDGKVVEFHSLIDSFDAAEQVLGHAIDRAAAGKPLEIVESGDRVTL